MESLNPIQKIDRRKFRKGRKGKIKNERYRKMLDTQIIESIKPEEFKLILQNIKCKYQDQAKALVIIIYYTGCRPAEALLLKPIHLDMKKGYITIFFEKTLKHGKPRLLFYSQRKFPLLVWVYDWAKKFFPEMLIFNCFISNSKRKFIGRKGDIKEYVDTTNRLKYYFMKWTKCLNNGSVPAYFFRHSRFNDMSEKGADVRLLMHQKGSSNPKSVEPYMHTSQEKAKKASKYY